MAHGRGYEPVAVTSRSGFDESVHFGAAVGLAADRGVAIEVGDPNLFVYPRSSCKPIQTDAMLRAGWVGSTEQVAIACASHAGTARHQQAAASTLASAGLGVDDLLNTPDLPLDDEAARAHVRAGGEPSSICQNCSGKHAAMLATCVVNGWPTATYLDPDHPLQLQITERMNELTGGVAHIGVDGCGAPAHVVSLVGMARAFRSIAAEQGVVWSAITAHPELVGGEGRDDTRLMGAIPGLMAKGGAEGFFAAAVPDGRSVAVKISDGGGRAAGVVAASVLRSLGVDVPDGAVGDPIRGHGEPVGTVRCVIGTAT